MKVLSASEVAKKPQCQFQTYVEWLERVNSQSHLHLLKTAKVGLNQKLMNGSANALESIILGGGIREQLSRYAILSSTHKDGR